MDFTGKYHLTKADLVEARKFASSVFLSTKMKYAEREQKSEKLIQKQAFEGKLAEIAVHKIISNKWIDITYPDMKVYYGKDKSYDADLQCMGMNLHVKTQNTLMMKRFGKGWMVQKNDPVVIKPQDNDYFVLTHINLKKYYVNIVAFVKCSDVYYIRPTVSALAKTKLVIQTQDMKVKKKLDQKEIINFFETKNSVELTQIFRAKQLKKEDLINIETTYDDDGEEYLRLWHFGER